MQLGQSVHRLAEAARIDVRRLVPGDVVLRIAQPVVGREVDDLATMRAQHRYGALRLHVRQRQEHDVGDVREPGGIQVVERQLGEPAQVRIDPRQRLAGQTLGGDTGERDARVRQQDAQELGAHVPAGAGDGYAKTVGGGHGAQRLEYWNFCRAPGWPYFFRSRMRGSRVSSPAFLSGWRSFSSKRVSARARPCRTAPAWPVGPPPATVATTSNWPCVAVISKGCAMIMRSVSRGK